MSGERILVVDDEPNIVELARMYLEQEGFRVEAAAAGAKPIGPHSPAIRAGSYLFASETIGVDLPPAIGLGMLRLGVLTQKAPLGWGGCGASTPGSSDPGMAQGYRDGYYMDVARDTTHTGKVRHGW